MLDKHLMGTTNIPVTRMGLGMAALGRPGYINLGHADDLEHNYNAVEMEVRAFGVLDAAYAAGVRYFDTARSYGRGEAFLANWLQSRDVDPAEVGVGSKWGYTYTADWKVEVEHHEIKEHSLAVLDRQWEETQALLGSYLDLYQVHSATLESGVMQNSAVLSRLAELKAAGIAIGFSVSGPRQAEVIAEGMKQRVDGVPLFDCVQATWNILEPSSSEILAEAHELGLGILVKEALANGRLTPRNDSAAFLPKMKMLQAQAHRLETTVDAIALSAALRQPWVDVVLSGAAVIEHLHSNLAGLEVPTDADLDAVLTSLQEEPNVYWSIRNSLAWN